MCTRDKPAGVLPLTLVGAIVLLFLAPGGTVARAAEPCPDIGVVFARGTAESPGVGNIGRSFKKLVILL